jgi:pyridoxamine 5'-phosphate oxidase
MRENLPDNPLQLFQNWLSMARESEINDPDAMALATCGKDGRPHVRMVLLKSFDENGFKFHTNCESDKGQQLAENPFASLCFYWKSLRKQVRVDGAVIRAGEDEADQYFADRPYARQVGAWASQQSRPLESRDFLENKINEFKKLYPEGTNVPRPRYWVGYRVVPQSIEFWWDNPDRLHDRFVYEKNTDQNWTITRLYP